MSSDPQDLPYAALGARPPAVAHYDTGLALLSQAEPLGSGQEKLNLLAQAATEFLGGLLRLQLEAGQRGGGWG